VTPGTRAAYIALVGMVMSIGAAANVPMIEEQLGDNTANLLGGLGVGFFVVAVIQSFIAVFKLQDEATAEKNAFKVRAGDRK